MKVPSISRLCLPATLELAARIGLGAWRRVNPARGAGNLDDGTPSGSCRPAYLREILSQAGIGRGTLLLVHSDTAGVARFGLSPSEFIDTLLEIIGPDGTLVMPSHPVLREKNGQLFYDVRRSPSSVGMVTELFRRRPGVLRSAFPYSAAAAMGPLADTVVGSHGRSTRPHDASSPYAKLAQLGGRVLCVGCALDRMTVLHVAEDELPPEHQIPGFYVPVSVTVKSGEDLRVVDAEVRAPWLWWYLHLTRWNQEMLQNKLATQLTAAPANCYVAEAQKIVDWMRSDFQQKKGLYPLAKLNRWLRLSEPAFAKAE